MFVAHPETRADLARVQRFCTTICTRRRICVSFESGHQRAHVQTCRGGIWKLRKRAIGSWLFQR